MKLNPLNIPWQLWQIETLPVNITHLQLLLPCGDNLLTKQPLFPRDMKKAVQVVLHIISSTKVIPGSLYGPLCALRVCKVRMITIRLNKSRSGPEMAVGLEPFCNY